MPPDDLLTPTTPAELSRDIKLLGGLLGVIIREQHGDAAFEAVEQVRAAAKARRAGEPGAAEAMQRLIDVQDLSTYRVLIKAFTNYFQLTNIAEDQQRIRVLREARGRACSTSLIGGAGCASFRRAGVSADEMRAHPEPHLDPAGDDGAPSEAKRQKCWSSCVTSPRRWRCVIASGWCRARRIPCAIRWPRRLWSFGRPARRAPSAPRWKTKWSRESYYITAVIRDSAVDLYDGPARALHDAYPGGGLGRAALILHYASWIGGDRDGKPERHARGHAGDAGTLRVAARAVYLRALDSLSEHLTQSVDEAPVDPALAPPDGAPGV